MSPLRPLILAPLIASALAPSASAVPLTPYGNPRFNFWVDVPASLRRLPPPDNGDGQAWRTLSGRVNLSMWGSFAPGVYGETSVQATLNREKKELLGGGSRLTYTHLAADQEFPVKRMRRVGRSFQDQNEEKHGQHNKFHIARDGHGAQSGD